nr:hypothetical protein [uncultured Flavobacterium sp.]
MKITMQFTDSVCSLDYSDWDIAFVGNAINKRGNEGLEFIKEKSSQVIIIEYIPSIFKMKFGEDEFFVDDINKLLESHIGKNILIDSTTLNFAEILIIMQALKDLCISNFSILYIEPKNYNIKDKVADILHQRDFELSESIVGYEAIPGHALLLTSEVTQKVVFLCGYESERIDRALEDSDIQGSNCSCIFGIPAYIPGWEMNSFDNNITVIKEKGISGGINFCGATNPLAIYKTLDNIYAGLENDDEMFIVPLATKPMNIGACLFLLSKPKEKVAVLYDHPKEIKDKAIEISKWHLFDITLS